MLYMSYVAACCESDHQERIRRAERKGNEIQDERGKGKNRVIS